MGRILDRFNRFYSDGYDLSGFARQTGELKWEYEAPTDAALSEAVKNLIGIGQASISPGILNAFFDTTASVGPHATHYGAGVKRTVLIAQGGIAEPVAGVPAFCGEFPQLDYKAKAENGFMVATITFGDSAAAAQAINYSKPWGVLVHAKAAETAVNTGTGIDDNGVASGFGGYLCYQCFTSNGTVTLKVQDAATNLDASFADLSGATSGSIDATSTPAAGIVALANSATVRRYLRWQIVFGTATTVTFALGFVRANY